VCGVPSRRTSLRPTLGRLHERSKRVTTATRKAFFPSAHAEEQFVDELLEPHAAGWASARVRSGARTPARVGQGGTTKVEPRRKMSALSGPLTWIEPARRVISCRATRRSKAWSSAIHPVVPGS
jgi:hypothetical protein